MYKNFSPYALGINGRQSELIELALTYAFRGMDVDMIDMLRRSQRTNVEDATKYVRSAEIKIAGFELEIDLDADDDAFKNRLGALHPVAELAGKLKADCAYVIVPPATDRLPYHEYFDTQRDRLTQLAELLGNHQIKLAIGFHAGRELGEGKQFEFVRNVEGLLALVRGVTAPNAGLLLDTWDWVIGDGAMDQISELKPEEIIAVRLGSIPKDVDVTKAISAERTFPEKDGPLNHVALVKHLASVKFKGPIGPTASNKYYRGETREKMVQTGQEAIDEISKEAGVHVAPRPMDLIEDFPAYEPAPAN